MKKLILIISQIIITLFLILTLWSCGKLAGDDDLGPSQCNVEDLEMMALRFVDASVAYGNEQSLDNCKNYKEALEDYIELLEGCSLLFGSEVENSDELFEELDC